MYIYTNLYMCICIYMYMDIYTYIYTYLYTYIYILYINTRMDVNLYILGSGARLARAEAYRIILWDYITGLFYENILQDNIMG